MNDYDAMTAELWIIRHIENRYGPDPTDDEVLEALRDLSVLNEDGTVNYDEAAHLVEGLEAADDEGGSSNDDDND